MSDSLNIPGLNELIWYEKIDLAQRLMTKLIPETVNESGELQEIIYLTDNLLGITPPDRLNLAIQLLTEIKQTYFTK